MPRILPALLALVLILAAGLVHGLWAQRWGVSEELQAAAERLKHVPLIVGDWEGKDLRVDERNFEQAGAVAYLSRQYTHRRTRESVVVILMCGRSGYMAVHTPEVCYQGAGFEMVEAPASWLMRGAGGEELGTFWSARFGKVTAGSRHLRLLWGWGTGEDWQAPASPRWEFRWQPYLYKLYLSLDASNGDSSSTEGPAFQFTQEFLPALKTALAAPEP